MEEFKDFIKNIPENTGVPLEEAETDPVHESESLINELEVLKSHESAKEAQIALLPLMQRTIIRLKSLQNENIRTSDESLRNTLMKLIAEEERIRQMVN